MKSLHNHDRVKRGPTWGWGDQDSDHGKRLLGTVLIVGARVRTSREAQWYRVIWDNGRTNTYSYGGNRQDIILVHKKQEDLP